ncbi:DUF488 domain-containing protein [Cohnella caldifontis]|uniref:DUF488 domain-containing protein n=1 Tax=Cohnella caldifontis TaxID=3027471 RepID=UPI0023EAF1B6|nr:DUF488 domain-containing protein [Cohnella sp. YIM B05605]
MGETGNFRIKRIYEPAEESDGVRVLVDRLWPRGISKERARLDEWMKDVAPSSALCAWFGHDPERFGEFRSRYEAELAEVRVRPCIGRLNAWAENGPVTLLYGARDERHNQAVVLLEYLTGQAAY